MSKSLFALVFALSAAPLPAADEAPRTFEGPWNNRLYNSSGTMTCVATPGKDGEWTATFTGVFMGEKFKYDVTFRAKPGKGQQLLSGTAKIRNHSYEWTGTLKGDTLSGKYRANSGYNGEFTLKEKK